MSIATNKVLCVTAALCADNYSRQRSIKINNVDIMALGAFTVDPELAKSMARPWLNQSMSRCGRSEPKIQRIDDYDEEHSK